jgi:TRAP-type mannitol/chloroaromatic compound transport system substrate-binding protein
MTRRTISNRAALVAVIVAFGVGTIMSLALRPAGGHEATAMHSDGSTPVRIRWRLPVSFASNMPVLGDNPIYVTEMLRAASSGAVDLTVYEPGEVVPPFSISDAVRDGKVEAGYTWLGYDQGKIPASPLIGAVPFGMEPWEFAAWWFEAGGRELGEELYEAHGMHLLFCGLTGPETAGWFRKRIESLDDVRGLKIRFAGIGGKVLERLGASVTMIPGGEIFQALEKGAIDASEYALPIVDQALGFNRIARYNYYPGWHQPSTAPHMLVNLDVWRALTEADRKLIEMACTAGVIRNLANSEASEGAIIEGYPALGVSAETLPGDVLRELEVVTAQVLDEEAARDVMFRRILDAQREFRATYAHWKALAYLPRDF